MTHRRHFLRSTLGLLGGSYLGLAMPRNADGSALGPVRSGVAGRPAPPQSVRLGVASYSLREWDRERSIQAIRDCGVTYVNVKSFHLPYEASSQEIADARSAFADAGLQIVGGGLITFAEDTDEAMRASFEYARAAGFPVIVAGPKPEVLPRLERFAVEYDIKIAIHNHGPEDAYFPAPSDALAAVRGMDTRMGVCVDVGHTARTGRDVVTEIALAGERLHDIHMKDLADLSDKGSQCIVGRGAMPIRDIFAQLEIMRYPGYVNLEYEIDADNPLPGMRESFAYMRGVLAGMG